jgi:hypothetical protein
MEFREKHSMRCAECESIIADDDVIVHRLSAYSKAGVAIVCQCPTCGFVTVSRDRTSFAVACGVVGCSNYANDFDGVHWLCPTHLAESQPKPVSE